MNKRTVRWVGAVVLAVCFGVNVSAAEVVAIGDSMMRALGRSLRRHLGEQELKVEAFTSIGSGLARLDLLDWHTQAAELVNAHKPSVIFVMMGANDNQPMQIGGGVLQFGTDGWRLEYGRRAGKLMDVLLEEGALQVVWIGLPEMREAKLNADVRAIENIVLQQVQAREKVVFFETQTLFSSGDSYRAYIILDNGMPLEVRAGDGIHLNRHGADYLARVLSERFMQ